MHFQRVVLAIALSLVASLSEAAQTVTAYVALDRDFSTPVLEQFEKETGIRVNAVYDVEASKTVGLVNRIINEKDRPLCDVFWNNEILQTLRLKEAQCLQPYESPSAESLPAQFRDPQNYWNGFAARARVIIFNTEKVKREDVPLSMFDWGSQPAHEGQFAVADAHFGTTSTHLPALVSIHGETKTREMIEQWKMAGVAVLAGNATVRNEVAAGRYAFGLTDTDDVFGALDEGKPVGILYPKEGLLIPNSVALIANAPHAETGKKLIDFILRPQTERMLAESPGGQIPLRHEIVRPQRVPAIEAVNSLPVVWPEVLKNRDAGVKLADLLATR